MKCILLPYPYFIEGYLLEIFEFYLHCSTTSRWKIWCLEIWWFLVRNGGWTNPKESWYWYELFKNLFIIKHLIVKILFWKKVATDLTITPQRAQVISFAPTLLRYKMVLVIKTPSPSINFLTYLAPFHLWVWVVIIILFGIVLRPGKDVLLVRGSDQDWSVYSILRLSYTK